MYNPKEKRVPAGSSTGGQWTSGDASSAIQKAASDIKDRKDQIRKAILSFNGNDKKILEFAQNTPEAEIVEYAHDTVINFFIDSEDKPFLSIKVRKNIK